MNGPKSLNGILTFMDLRNFFIEAMPFRVFTTSPTVAVWKVLGPVSLWASYEFVGGGEPDTAWVKKSV